MSNAMDGIEKNVGTKISGYLERKSRKMMSCYKKYWFVLEGRLLLYYRSKDEYEAISPCKGSVNLGPTCAVKPCARIGAFQIVSRTTTITLRAETREDQHKWMQALTGALRPSESPARLSHFRYSLGELSPEPKKPLERQNTMPERLNAPRRANPGIIEKLQKLGAHSYLDFSMTNVYKKTQPSARSNEDVAISDPRNTLLIDNGDYSAQWDTDKFYEKIPQEATVPRSDIDARQPSLLIENVEYVSISESNGHKNEEEKIYEEPKYDVIDYNENSVTLGDSPADKENPYSVPILNGECEVSENPRIGSASSESLNEERTTAKFFGGFVRRNKKDGTEGRKARLKKSESFLQRVWKKKTKNQKNKTGELLLANNNMLNELELSDAGTIKMLSALQNVLESKKPIIQQTLIGETRKSELGRETAQYANSPSSITGDAGCPELPPRNQKPMAASPYPDAPKSDQLIGETVDRSETNSETKEETPREGKVRNLIKRFSEEFEGVEIRHKNAWKKPATDRNSGDLDKLLDELSKVASAPIMTPGVTTSLVDPEMPDSELLKLIPIRRRRLSDPDYDVPRSHRLVNLPTRQENSVTGTRFFGPALDPVGLAKSRKYDSMTPDSLEVDPNRDISYQSHDYLNIIRSSHHRIEYFVENSLYAEPRSSVRCDPLKVAEDPANDSVFDDSLEMPIQIAP
ncbi:pleckstrin homology domain-containing family A member 4-like isoform X2 [Cylas formicarius]|uniref:pleckstrin homology domain-containing family A member 4-like isoform X2 n=1 Tax=Cylas formicarius TaxID=197179 RepID=UPI0029586E27|nr:pleckstrin homology domain-containing family A member 4-like isoform X2 [Cylas formicarius]